jgi:thiamine-phosphate pyrophosphorylase
MANGGKALLRGLYVITDEQLCPGRTHARIARAAIEGGARIIQIRDKVASDRAFYEAAVEVRRITAEAGALMFVNDRVHIAAAVRADGVNVGQTDLPVSAARSVLGPYAIIGVSADSPDEALRAEAEGADYVGFGPVFPTTTKLDAGPVSGLDTLRVVCQRLRIPVVAIGGISASNAAQVYQAGAACAAVVSAIVCADDVTAATASLLRYRQWE